MEGARQISRQKTIDDFINEDDPITAYPGESIFDIHQFATERLDDELESYKVKKEASDASKEAVNRMFQNTRKETRKECRPSHRKGNELSTRLRSRIEDFLESYVGTLHPKQGLKKKPWRVFWTNP